MGVLPRDSSAWVFLEAHPDASLKPCHIDDEKRRAWDIGIRTMGLEGKRLTLYRGRDLVREHDKLPHGDKGSWVKDQMKDFGLSKSTIYNYMAFARAIDTTIPGELEIWVLDEPIEKIPAIIEALKEGASTSRPVGKDTRPGGHKTKRQVTLENLQRKLARVAKDAAQLNPEEQEKLRLSLLVRATELRGDPPSNDDEEETPTGLLVVEADDTNAGTGTATWNLHEEDCREAMPKLPDASFDSIVTDPPYGLRLMGRDWDHGVPGKAHWEEALRVAKPGAHMLAFGGTRTFHRLACAMEDAGWEIRDCIMWVYGSGMPKSFNLKEDWQGWGTALKPAWESIILARKPLSERTVAANMQRHGTGALNIDGCRVPSDEPNPSVAIRESAKKRGKAPVSSRSASEANATGRMERRGRPEVYWEPRQGEMLGRWPANLIHDGSPEVIELFPDSKAKHSESKGGGKSRPGNQVYDGAWERVPGRRSMEGEGSAARFFYCPKASRKERGEGNRHPSVKPLALMRYLVRLVTPPGGKVLDPFAGSGTTGIAALAEGFDSVLIEKESAYCDIARKRLSEAGGQEADASSTADTGGHTPPAPEAGRKRPGRASKTRRPAPRAGTASHVEAA